MKDNILWTPELEDQIDYNFMLRVQQEVTQSCSLPFALPIERLPSYIMQAAQYFWENSDIACEERLYLIKNSDICRCGKFNKIIQLPYQILGVHGVYKINEALKYGAMGDFSLERMMLSSYSMSGGLGGFGAGPTTNTGTGYALTEVVAAMYEVDTYNQTLNPPLSYNFNQYSSKLAILGDLGYSNLLINCNIRCRIQDLYNSYYFFRFVVCLCKKALSTIYGTFEFKLPGGVTINYSNFSDAADNELEKIEEWVQNNRSVDYFFMPNTL